MDAVRALVDDVFVRSRGLTRSLATRYPDIFEKERAANVFVALQGHHVVSAIATRPIAWRSSGSEGWVAALGLLATDPAYRGRGVGTAVLEAVVESVAADDASAAVLWATRPRLYQRLGWQKADPGVVGTGAGGGAQRDAPVAEMLDAEVATSLAAIRVRHATEVFARAPGTWRVVPAPADAVYAYRSAEAYALLGRRGDRGYLYELVGHEHAFPVLWAAIRRDVSTVVVNDAPGTPSHRWLSQRRAVEWEPKPLAMWLGLDDSGSAVAGSYVPYFDRI